jgi:DHA3 family macrolide efflux protein-like MFS transporter
MVQGPLRARAGALARERLEPLRPSSYRRVASALMVSNVGNGMQFIANVWLVLQLTDHPWGVPVVLLTGALPGVLFGPFIGIAMDFFPRRLLFVVTDVTAAVVLGVTAGLLITGNLQTWHVYAAVFFLGLVESISMPTGAALVREIVPVDKLLPANATSGVAIQLGQVTGAAAGGFLIALSSVTSVLLVNLVSFVVSALLILRLRDAGRSRSVPTGPRGWRSTLDWSAKGLVYLRAHPALLPSYVMLLVLFATLYLLNTLLAPYAVDVLQVGSGGLGLIDAMFALGAVAGGVALPLLTARVNRDRLAGIGVVGMGVALVGMGLASGLLVPMLMYAAMGMSFQSFYIFRTRVQEQVPVDLQGRVMALLITSVGVCRLVVYASLAVFAGAVTLRTTYVVGGTLLALLGVLVTVAAFRRPAASAPPRLADDVPAAVADAPGYGDRVPVATGAGEV